MKNLRPVVSSQIADLNLREYAERLEDKSASILEGRKGARKGKADVSKQDGETMESEVRTEFLEVCEPFVYTPA